MALRDKMKDENFLFVKNLKPNILSVSAIKDTNVYSIPRSVKLEEKIQESLLGLL